VATTSTGGWPGLESGGVARLQERRPGKRHDRAGVSGLLEGLEEIGGFQADLTPAHGVAVFDLIIHLRVGLCFSN
jgi:hypothetical protein